MTAIYETDDRFSPATLQYFAPNLRCITDGTPQTWVEIPDGWEGKYHWDRSAQVRDAIATLIREHGKRAHCFEGRRSNLPQGINGYRVPVEAWDAVMKQVVGVNWDKSRISDDEAMAILRAHQS